MELKINFELENETIKDFKNRKIAVSLKELDITDEEDMKLLSYIKSLTNSNILLPDYLIYEDDKYILVNENDEILDDFEIISIHDFQNTCPSFKDIFYNNDMTIREKFNKGLISVFIKNEEELLSILKEYNQEEYINYFLSKENIYLHFVDNDKYLSFSVISLLPTIQVKDLLQARRIEVS